MARLRQADVAAGAGYATTVRRRPDTRLAKGAALLFDYALDLVLLLTAYLVATYWREVLPFGKYVGTNYQWHTPAIYLTVALGLALAYGVRRGLQLFLHQHPGHLATLLYAIPLVDVTITLLMPRQSGLQKGYFTLLALPLALLVVPPAAHENADVGAPPLIESIRRLLRNRELLRMWVYFNVHSRYSQALLGALWIILLPLSTALVMTAVFSEVMRIHTGNTPFIAFFLAGFVPWGLFNQGVSGSMRSMLGTLGLINQIYFPREIIVLSALGEAMVDAFFMFVTMLIINALAGVEPSTLWVFLPLLLAIQIALMLGIMFTVSWLSVLVRDIPQLVSVLLQMLFYLCPIIYPATVVPERYRFLINLNPMGLLIEAWRNVIVYGRMPDWFSLIYPTALAAALLIFGYRHFKANEDRFADMI